MVADEPIGPEVLAQVLEIPTARGRGDLPGARRPATRSTTAASCSSGSPAATATRATRSMAPYVERFVLEGQSARMSAAALETLADRRLQAAGEPGAGVGHPRRQRRRRDAHAAAAGLHRRGRARSRPGPGGALRHHDAVPREARASTRSQQLPPLGEFVPGRRGGRGARARAGRATLDTPRAEHAASGDEASACRRCSPGRTRQPAGVRGPDRRGTGEGQRRGRRPRPAGRPARRRHRGRRRPRADRARPRLLPVEQADRRRHHRGRHPRTADGRRPRPRRPAGVPGRPPRRRHRGPAAAHQRRRADPPPDPSVVRRREGVPGVGRGRPVAGRAAPAARGRRARRRA